MPHGAIAAGHPKTAEAGAEIFRLGGNVFDAVVAAAMASFVVEPTLTSPAGGGFLLAHTQDDQNILFDFFSQTPRQKRAGEAIDFYPVEVNFGSVIQEFHIGLGSIAVPGAIAGLFHVHKRLGRLPLSIVAEPAIEYARSGVEIGPFQAYCLRLLTPILTANPAARRIYTHNGSILQAGMLLTMPELADTLEHSVQEGARAFYQGDIAQRLVQDCQEKGGYLTLADLENYRVIERSPFVTDYRGNQVLSNPPPSSGGALIAFALALLANLDMPQFGSSAHLQALAKVMQLTNFARKDGYDARLYEADVAERFLAPNHLADYERQLATNKWGSTTHISAIDSEGNAASITTTNGEGSSYIIPGTGIMTNNMLGEADLHPNGFHQWQENVRISSMMAPTIILQNHQPEVVLGSGGSNRIRTAILQVISNLIDFGMPVEAAVNSPRVHWEAGVFNVEPGFGGLADGAVDKAADEDDRPFPFDGQVELWSQQNMFFGGVHTVTRSLSGELAGSGDRRRSGTVAIA